MLGVAADLQHPLAHLGEGGRQVRAGRRFADAALAIDREHLGALDLRRSVLMDLYGAFSVLSLERRNLVARAHVWPVLPECRVLLRVSLVILRPPLQGDPRWRLPHFAGR